MKSKEYNRIALNLTARRAKTLEDAIRVLRIYKQFGDAHVQESMDCVKGLVRDTFQVTIEEIDFLMSKEDSLLGF